MSYAEILTRPPLAGTPNAAWRGERHRADIEGLRGISIVSVVLYHVHAPLAPGGFFGVDIFFVISGFLITTLLLREAHETGRIDLAAFWARRARRILPAATLVLLVTLSLAPIFAHPIDVRSLARDGASAALFGLNWRLANNSVDYFDSSEAPSALQHYWSLAVEEQFYLIWPLLLVAF